jgi:Tat protein secretion system quality control protein TatD with DNase activity
MYGGRSGRAKGKAPKSKKLKCSLCDAKGHNVDQCPYKETKEFVKTVLSKPTTLSFGKTHKTSRKAGSVPSAATEGNPNDSSEALDFNIFQFFPLNEIDSNNGSSAFYAFDAGCDIAATLDMIATMTGSHKKSKAQYQNALQPFSYIYGGCITRYLLKPEKPFDVSNDRVATILDVDPNICFAIGLGPGFLMHMLTANGEGVDVESSKPANFETKEEYEYAVTALLNAVQSEPDNGKCRIVGLYAKLDYTPETLSLMGYDAQTQLYKLRATCDAAVRTNRPIQIRIYPGAPNGTIAATSDSGVDAVDEEETRVLSDAYKQAVRDLAKVLLEMTPSKESERRLRVHLSGWNGTEAHMMHFLHAFPEDVLYVGMNATVGFSKQKHMHECAFSVPLQRLLLESDAPQAIPSPMVQSMNRRAFCHSGCILYAAASIAEHKRHVSALEVARIATENTVRLYGDGAMHQNNLSGRAEEAKQASLDRIAEKRLSTEEESIPCDDHTKETTNYETAVNSNVVSELERDQELLAELVAELAVHGSDL